MGVVIVKELIRLSNIVKRYPSGESEIRALDGVSLSIQKGEFVAITGTSGSGKSTLMNLLGCLDLPAEGLYELDGTDVCSLTDRELSKIRNQKIGFVFQGFNLIPSLNALENVELPLTYRDFNKRRRRALAQKALCAVGLAHRMHHTPSQMSGGQQQRVAIARALAADPEMILADEPTGNLDFESSQEVLTLLTRLNQSGKTVILITHDPSIAARTKRMIQIQNGRVTFDQKRKS